MLDKTVVFDWGDWADLPTLAHRLFAGLRQLDAAGVDVILCPLPPAKGLGTAIQDRLLKAAKTNKIDQNLWFSPDLYRYLMQDL